MVWETEDSTARFEEASDWFLRRLPMTDDEFASDVERARRTGFWLSGVTDAAAVREVMSSMQDALDRGVPFEKWRDEVGPNLTRAWGGEDAPRVETTVRNWIMRSYNEARWHQQTSPAVKKLRPYGRFDAVRPTPDPTPVCTSWNDKVMEIEEFAKLGLQPPLHHRCQSSIQSLTRRAAERAGIITPSDGPGDRAQKGWGKYQDEWEPDIDEVDDIVPDLPVRPPAPASVDDYREAGYFVDDAAPQKMDDVFGRRLTPAEMDRLLAADVLDLPGARVDRSIYSAGARGDLLVGQAQYFDVTGRQLANVIRTYKTRPGGGIVAKNMLFTLKRSLQGKGIGSRVILSQMAAYEAMGIDRVELDASWAGRYVWARAGFELPLAETERLKKRMQKWLVKKGWGKDAAGKAVSRLRTVQDISLFATRDGRRWGKEFLLTGSGRMIRGFYADVGSPEWEKIKKYLGRGRDA